MSIRRAVGLVVAAFLAPVKAVLAQDDPAQNTLPELKSQAPLVAWALAALFLVASLAIAFKNSKRTHLD